MHIWHRLADLTDRLSDTCSTKPVVLWICQCNETPGLMKCSEDPDALISPQSATKSEDNVLSFFAIIIPDAHVLLLTVTKIISRSHMPPIFCRDMTAVNKRPHLNLEHLGTKTSE